MKKFMIIILLFAGTTVKAQSYELERLLLDIQKLAQMKNILTDLYKGYEILNSGYNTIKDISQGNFNLHKAFLDGLMEVSPGVRKYKRIIDIITSQGMLVKEYKSAFTRFKKSNLFNATEIEYMASVYTNLFDKSLQCLDELLMVITAGKLRMSDDQRLAAIDRIFSDMEDKLSFLRNFNRSASVLVMQRGKETIDTKTTQQLYGVH